jgi:outer membrane protein OmpA-like peptidoglycan-associated protein
MTSTPAARSLARLATAFAILAASASAGSAQVRQGSLGSKDPGLFNLTGSIYFLNSGEARMPADLDLRKIEGTIYTDRIDVPVRSFTEGFPGITKRFEWFGVLYTGRFYVDVPGDYRWSLQSDDGSRLWIDGKPVIDNDGVHGFRPAGGSIDLPAGPHDMKLWYFQGPPTEIGLQLSVTPPGGAKKIFNLAEFAGPMAAAAKTLKAEATPNGIRIRLDAALLFDTAKWDLKPSAQQAIKNLGVVVAAYPGALIRVVGFTDAVGGDEYNLELSRSRAQSVKDALVALNPTAGVTFDTEGLGKAQPVASNDTAAGRALNRRVEVFIKPQAAPAIDATSRPDVQSQEARLAAQSAKQAQAAAAPAPPAPPGPPPPAPRAAAPAAAPPNSAAAIAAANRVRYVIERYVEALNRRDEAALGEVRDPISESESALLRAREVKVAVEVATVDATATAATAACRRTIAATSSAGAPIRADGNVVIHLTRRPSGWVIDEIR